MKKETINKLEKEFENIGVSELGVECGIIDDKFCKYKEETKQIFVNKSLYFNNVSNVV